MEDIFKFDFFQRNSSLFQTLDIMIRISSFCVSADMLSFSFDFECFVPEVSPIQECRVLPVSRFANPRGYSTYYYPFQLANLFRRILASQIEVPAIDTVEVICNESPLVDELLTFRLGLIPIRISSPANLENVTLTLNLSGPLTVLSSHFVSSSPNIQVKPDIEIISLGKGQRLSLKAYLRLGTAEKHAKWSPVASLYYEYVNPHLTNTQFRFKADITGSLTPSELLLRAKQIFETQVPWVTIDLPLIEQYIPESSFSKDFSGKSESEDLECPETYPPE